MICSECRHAALLNEKGLHWMEQGRVKDAEAVFEASEDAHAQCKPNKGCFCQHHTRSNLVNP